MSAKENSEAAEWMLAPAAGREENAAASSEHIGRSALPKGWGLAEHSLSGFSVRRLSKHCIAGVQAGWLTGV